MRRILVLCLAFLSVVLSGDLGAEESWRTGVILLHPDYYRGIPSVPPTISVGPLPDTYDLSSQFPPPGDQRPQQSCAAWAVVYAVKSYQEKKERGWEYSTDHLFSPAFIYNRLIGDPGCQQEVTLPEVMAMVTEYGAAPLSVFRYNPEDCSAQPDDQILQSASEFFAVAFRKANYANPGEIKRLLVMNQPIIIAMMISNEFFSLSPGATYSPSNLNSLNLRAHALVVVGYDNNRQAFRVMNSWGNQWADGGFGWVSYQTFENWVREAYVLFDFVTGSQTAILVETVLRREVPFQAKAKTLSTDNNHCSSNCQGEPTRKNYQMALEADPGAELRNPRLSCLSGPCEGWNQVLNVHLEAGSRRAVASWDTWSTPTTWQLSADQVKLEELRVPSRLKPGENFTVEVVSGEPRPSIRVVGPVVGPEDVFFTLMERWVDTNHIQLTYRIVR